MPKRFRTPTPIQALRIFFGAYFILTAGEWRFGRPARAHLRIFSFFSSDLWGFRDGVELSDLALKLQFIRDSWSGGVVLLTLFIAVLLFLQNRRPRLAATLILLLLLTLGYASAGRNITFEIISYSFMAYWAATLLVPLLKDLSLSERDLFLRVATLSGFGCTYFSAGLSKIVNSGWPWIGLENLQLLLSYGKFRSMIALGDGQIQARLIELLHTQWAAHLLLGSCIAIELMAIAIPFFGTLTSIYLGLVLLLNLGMFLVLHVFWPPLTTFVIVAMIPWKNPSGPPAPNLKLRHRFMITAISLGLLTASWTLPDGEFKNSSRYWPFSRFGMYSVLKDHVITYYFRGSDGVIVNSFVMTRELRASIQYLNFPPQSPTTICDFARNRAPSPGKLRKSHAALWKHQIDFDPIANQIFESDAYASDCF
jgi:hypothetical protein